MNAQMLFGGLGARELILLAAMAFLMAGISRLTAFSRREANNGAAGASSRAYLDRLLGPRVGPVRGRTRGGAR